MPHVRRTKPPHKMRWLQEAPPMVLRVFIAAGGPSYLAFQLGVTPVRVREWKQIPEHHLDAIYHLTGIHPIEMRPDVFDPSLRKPRKIPRREPIVRPPGWKRIRRRRQWNVPWIRARKEFL